MNDPGETVRLLAERIRRLESACRPCAPASIPLESGGLGELFPQGLAAGSLVELFPRVPGAGAWTLALILARHVCGEQKTLLIADPERCFYPLAARKFGLDPGRTVIVRPRTANEALLTVAQALRCCAIGTAIGAFERLADRDGRRLQLAAESGGTVGVLLRPVSALNTPSFAAVRLLMDPLPSSRGRRRVRLEVLRCRQTAGGSAFAEKRQTVGHFSANAKPQAVWLEIDDATGHVRAFSPLELATDLASAARSTG
jgi:protein ImuA